MTTQAAMRAAKRVSRRKMDITMNAEIIDAEYAELVSAAQDVEVKDARGDVHGRHHAISALRSALARLKGGEDATRTR